jgi:hypothetical protein
MNTRATFRRLAIATGATLATLAATLASASPCTAPASFVKAPEAARAPLLRPFVLAGLTSTALQLRGEERWLELAVPSVASAQRALAGAAGVAETPRLTAADGVVLLACSSLGAPPERLAQQTTVPLAAPLW